MVGRRIHLRAALGEHLGSNQKQSALGEHLGSNQKQSALGEHLGSNQKQSEAISLGRTTWGDDAPGTAR